MKTARPLDRATLYDFGPVPTYSGRNLDQIAFPLGGIGTGMITLGGWGQLRDWEIMNRPARGFVVPNSFFAIKAYVAGSEPVTRIMEGPVQGSFTFDGHHPNTNNGEGLPRFANCEFTGTFPVANVALRDDGVPVRVDLEAVNPFVPHNPDDSGIPAAVLTYRVTNTSTKSVAVTLYGNLGNIIAGHAADRHIAEARSADSEDGDSTATFCGAYLSTAAVHSNDPQFGSMALERRLGRRALPCLQLQRASKENCRFPRCSVSFDAAELRARRY